MFDSIKNMLTKEKSSRVLNDAMTNQLKAYLEKLQAPVEIVASLDNGNKAHEMRHLLEEIAALSEKITARFDGTDSRKPSFSISRIGEAPRIRFAGIPLGHEFTSLVLALLHTGGHPPKLDPGIIEQIKALNGPLHFETYITMTCHNCPDGVQALNTLAALNPGISHTMIDGNMFLSEIDHHKIKVVPTIHLNGSFFDQGRKSVLDYLERINKGAQEREAGKNA